MSLLREWIKRLAAEEPGRKPEPDPRPPAFSDRALEVLAGAPGLRRRRGQMDMLRLVAQVLAEEREERCAAVEAGTGTGKSLAYLIPVMLHAVLEGTRAVVATGTRNLQEQLARKDAPFAADLVERAAGKRPAFAVLMGKGNYLCPALLEERLAELEGELARAAELGTAPVRPAELCFLDRVAAWRETGGSGMKDDLPIWPDLPAGREDIDRWWHRVSAADDDADCRECGEPACAFRAAREAAARADVVIANHHLVAADHLVRARAGFSLFSEKNRPAPEVLIVDEAHDFPEAFRSALEASFSRRRWERLRDDLRKFVLEELTGALREVLREQLGAKKKLKELDKETARAAKDLAGLAGKADRAVDDLLADATQALARTKRDRMLLLPEAPPAGGRAVLSAVEAYCEAALKRMEALLARLEAYVEPDKKTTRKAGRLRERCAELGEAVRRAVLLERHYRTEGPEGDCAEFDGRRFAARPVKLGKPLARLWAEYEHVIHTSATLFPFPQSEGFAWYREECGFAAEEAAMGVVPSPFDWLNQMRAFVLTDPELDPGDGEDDGDGGRFGRRTARLAEAVLRVADSAPGGVLALFTSFREMNAVADLVRGRLPADRLFLVQGRDGGRAEILKRFREHGKGVLFGVASFWQGVDVPGEALSALILAKLPFPQPDDPVVEALCRLAGGDWWQKVYRPLTALVLRQGVGRLIRTESDRGAVILCDPRAAGRHRWFLRCLPVEADRTEVSQL